jgi:hypothetical protein
MSDETMDEVALLRLSVKAMVEEQQAVDKALDDAGAPPAAFRSERVLALLERVRRLDKVLRDVVDAQGIDHETDDCPEDDTCGCLLIARVNKALEP